jgi:hypothetical protein
VAVIDTHALTVGERWPVAPAGSPVGMGMDREHRRLFSSGRNPQILDVMDADTGKIIQSLHIGEGVDANVFEAATGLLFVSVREGKIHVFHEDSPDKLTEVETVKTEYGAKNHEFRCKNSQPFSNYSGFWPLPAATKEKPKPQRSPIHGTFHLLVYGR